MSSVVRFKTDRALSANVAISSVVTVRLRCGCIVRNGWPIVSTPYGKPDIFDCSEHGLQHAKRAA